MANLTYRQLQDAFVGLVYKLRELNSDSELVRLAYQQNSMPFQEIVNGTSYIWINYADVDTSNQINEEYITSTEDEIILKRSQMRELEVHFIFYGDEDTQDIAYNFRNKLFSYKAKDYLDKYEIYLIPDIPEAVLFFEELNNQWWSRIEIIANYYINSELDETLERMKAVNVKLVTEKESLNRDVMINGKV